MENGNSVIAHCGNAMAADTRVSLVCPRARRLSDIHYALGKHHKAKREALQFEDQL